MIYGEKVEQAATRLCLLLVDDGDVPKPEARRVRRKPVLQPTLVIPETANGSGKASQQRYALRRADRRRGPELAPASTAPTLARSAPGAELRDGRPTRVEPEAGESRTITVRAGRPTRERAGRKMNPTLHWCCFAGRQSRVEIASAKFGSAGYQGTDQRIEIVVLKATAPAAHRGL